VPFQLLILLLVAGILHLMYLPGTGQSGAWRRIDGIVTS